MSDRFVGAKGGSGIAQWIISQMPLHETYVEAFLGTGVIIRTKRPAKRNIGIELDPITVDKYWAGDRDIDIYTADCLTMLPALQLESNALVYADPPYLNRRAGNREYYRHEALTEADHRKILEVLTSLKCMVMISGYWSDLYAHVLKNWRVLSKWTVNRAGCKVEEFLWMNFPPSNILHDARFIGADFTDRQRIKRKVARWAKRFESMEPGERFAVFEALKDSFNCAVRKDTSSYVGSAPGLIARSVYPRENADLPPTGDSAHIKNALHIES